MPNEQLHRKIIGVPLQKGMQKTPEGFLLVTGKFTSDNRDEVGDIITRAATERAIPKYRQWGNIRRMHQPDPIGRVTRIGVADGLEWNEVEICVIDPKAIFEVENGLLKALSVGILISLENLDILQDGGWVINDYQLAEISLVDHPANYDAVLTLSLDERTRTMIREQGLIPALRSLGITTKGELSMDQTKEKELETPVEEQPVGDLPQAQDVPEDVLEVEEEEAPAEGVVIEDQPIEQPVAEVEQKSVEETVVKAEEPDLLAQMFEMLRSLTDLVATLQEIVSQNVEPLEESKSLPVTEETPVVPEVPAAKALEAEAQPAGNGEQPEMDQLREQIKHLEAQVADLTAPANRKGALPVEEPPTRTPEPEEASAKNSAMGLRDAVKMFVNSHK